VESQWVLFAGQTDVGTWQVNVERWIFRSRGEILSLGGMHNLGFVLGDQLTLAQSSRCNIGFTRRARAEDVRDSPDSSGAESPVTLT
jgi:hypothetical protein